MMGTCCQTFRERPTLAAFALLHIWKLPPCTSGSVVSLLGLLEKKIFFNYGSKGQPNHRQKLRIALISSQKWLARLETHATWANIYHGKIIFDAIIQTFLGNRSNKRPLPFSRKALSRLNPCRLSFRFGPVRKVKTRVTWAKCEITNRQKITLYNVKFL